MDKAVKKRALQMTALTGAVLLCGLLYALFTKIFGFGISCIFNSLTGFSCPGCGNSRAAMAVLRLDFVSAFSYNALFGVEFFYIGFAYINAVINYIKGKGFIYRSPHAFFDVAFLLLILIWGVIRNII